MENSNIGCTIFNLQNESDNSKHLTAESEWRNKLSSDQNQTLVDDYKTHLTQTISINHNLLFLCLYLDEVNQQHEYFLESKMT